MTSRILLVDDEPDVWELFRQNFRREIRKGVYDFEHVQSGDEALELLGSRASQDVILVMSDINMPGMTGVELLETLKERWPAIPVFMITAYGDQATERAVHDKGAERFFSKPVDFTVLKQELTTVAAGAGR